MNKLFKRLLIFLISSIILLGLYVVAWVFLIYPNFVDNKDESAKTQLSFAEIAEQSDKIDFNEDDGMLYVNNEVVVVIRDNVADDKVSALFSSYDAVVDEAMADIGIYRLVFKKAMEYDDLESLIKKIEAESIVEKAYLNTVTAFDSDTVDEDDDFAYKSPVFSNDPWDRDVWNTDVPYGANWGVEAIDAPGAWAYLDSLKMVRIGLIDSMPELYHEDLYFMNSSCIFVDEETGTTTINKYNLSADRHGTHVSGTMNAKWDNSTGVAGVMGGKGELHYSAVYYESKGKISSKYGTAYSYLLALKTLIDQDVQVINISQNTNRLIGFAASHGNENAIAYLSMQADLTEKGLLKIISDREAENKPDFVICVAAGNSNSIYYYEDENATYGYREEMTAAEKLKAAFGWRGEIGNSLALYNNFLNLMDEEAVMDRVIVVGAVGIDDDASTKTSTAYSYAYFSNVGSRVDVVAPGVDVYSCTVGGYCLLSGTSMATPHVSGVAGLIFASNPSLTGPEVKRILVASSTGRYYHGAEYSGLVNANNAVVTALKTVDTSVETVISSQKSDGLDLCFIVDTTASMGDDIQNAKENMASILEHLAAKTGNYRVALIDYRDFSDRTGTAADYPAKVQLGFSSDNEAITEAINALDLGYGGDNEETVYSGLMAAVGLDWRKDAKKVIIILGDAAPLDPEPITNYTYDDVLYALFTADINLDYDDSDDRVVEGMDTSLINVFSIGTDASSDAADFFEGIASSTGGSYAGVDDAAEVGDAIIDSIEQIEVVETVKVNVDFGSAMANQKIDLYSGDEFMFTVETDEDGRIVLDAVEIDTYTWKSSSLYSAGTIQVEKDKKSVSAEVTQEYWFTPMLQFWHQHTLVICLVLLGYIALCFVVPMLCKLICGIIRKKKALAASEVEETPVVEETPETEVAPVAEAPMEAEATPAEEAPVEVEATPVVEAPVEAEVAPVEEAPVEVAVAPVVEESATTEDLQRFCTNCGFPRMEGARFCRQCGAVIEMKPVEDETVEETVEEVEAPEVVVALDECEPEKTECICPTCGFAYMEGARFCSQCGSSIEAKPVEETVEVAEATEREEVVGVAEEEVVEVAEAEEVVEVAEAEEVVEVTEAEEVVEVTEAEEVVEVTETEEVMEPAIPEFMFCENCGQQLPVSASFCGKCGTKVANK